MTLEAQETEQIDFSQTEGAEEVGEEQETEAQETSEISSSTETVAEEQPQKVVLPGREMTIEQVDQALAELEEKKRILAERERQEQQIEWQRTAEQRQQTAATEYEKRKAAIKVSASLSDDERAQKGLPDPIDLLIGTAVNIMENRFAQTMDQASAEEQGYQAFKQRFQADPEVADLRDDEWATREAYRFALENRIPKRAVIALLREWRGKPDSQAAAQTPPRIQTDAERDKRIRLAPAASGVQRETKKDPEKDAQRAFEQKYLGI